MYITLNLIQNYQIIITILYLYINSKSIYITLNLIQNYQIKYKIINLIQSIKSNIHLLDA
jgi:hypothetical protein